MLLEKKHACFIIALLLLVSAAEAAALNVQGLSHDDEAYVNGGRPDHNHYHPDPNDCELCTQNSCSGDGACLLIKDEGRFTCKVDPDYFTSQSVCDQNVGRWCANCVDAHATGLQPPPDFDNHYHPACSAHGDCSGPTTFCYEGQCASCEECHFCHDGIDNTCGTCGNGYPTMEEGPCDSDDSRSSRVGKDSNPPWLRVRDGLPHFKVGKDGRPQRKDSIHPLFGDMVNHIEGGIDSIFGGGPLAVDEEDELTKEAKEADKQLKTSIRIAKAVEATNDLESSINAADLISEKLKDAVEGLGSEGEQEILQNDEIDETALFL